METIAKVKPDLVCLSSATAESVNSLREVAQAVHHTFPHVKFGYGGRVFNVSPELRQHMIGTFLGHDARELVDNVNAMLSRPNPSA